MKKIMAVILGLGLTANWVSAGLYTYNNSATPFGGGTIVDGCPVGSVFSVMLNDASITAAGNVLAGVSVTLNLSGGYNGDLYSYLVAPNGTVVILLNQPGQTAFHNAGSGMTSVTLVGGSSYPDIQNVNILASQQLGGTYTTSAGNLDNFGTMSSSGGAANGNWMLFFADMAQGGGNETLTGWSLNLTVVPEPVNVALGVFVAMLLALAGIKRAWASRALVKS